MSDQSISAAGPRVCNSLPPHLRQDINVARFQHKLKTFLFRSWSTKSHHYCLVFCTVEIILLTYLFTYLLTYLNTIVLSSSTKTQNLFLVLVPGCCAKLSQSEWCAVPVHTSWTVELVRGEVFRLYIHLQTEVSSLRFWCVSAFTCRVCSSICWTFPLLVHPPKAVSLSCPQPKRHQSCFQELATNICSYDTGTLNTLGQGGQTFSTEGHI